jgi:hypothetical protein
LPKTQTWPAHPHPYTCHIEKNVRWFIERAVS